MQKKVSFKRIYSDYLSEICELAYTQGKEQNYNYNEIDIKYFLSQALSSNISYCVGAFKDDKLIGVCCFLVTGEWYNQSEITAKEILWYVLPEYRNGVGSLLLNYVESKINCVIFDIGIASAHTPLIKLLERKGYYSYKNLMRKNNVQSA